MQDYQQHIQHVHRKANKMTCLPCRAALQDALRHHVTLHSHLQLVNPDRNAALTGRTQRTQILTSPDAVDDHRPVLRETQKVRQICILGQHGEGEV